MKKTSIGIDVGKDSLTYCVLNENGHELEVGEVATKTMYALETQSQGVSSQKQ